jgi:hypothetical protein
MHDEPKLSLIGLRVRNPERERSADAVFFGPQVEPDVIF